MEESSKGASCAESKKRLSCIESDDGLEKDFLVSWKFAADGKDTLDFASDAPNSNKKKPFSFEKIDGFEFGDDFGKLSSFNIDMSDLDFPCTKKSGKMKDIPSKESSLKTADRKQDAFSFNFDFDELEGFGLNSNLLCENDNNGTILSAKTDTDSDSGNKPVSAFDVVKIDTKNNDKVTTFKSDLSEEPLGQYQELPSVQKNEDEGIKNEVPKELPDILQVVNSSINHSMDDFPDQHANGNEYSEQQTKVEVESEKSGKLSGSPDSRGSSSAKAFNLKCSQETCKTVPASVDKRSRSHSGDKKDQISRSITVESSGVKKGTEDASISAASVVLEVSSKPGFVSKKVEDYQSSNNEVLVSPKHRDETFMLVNLNGSAMQLNSTVNPVSCEAPQNVFPNGGKNCSISDLKTENLHLFPANGKSAVEGPVQNLGNSKSFDRTPATRKGLLDRESDTEKKYESSISKLPRLSTNITRDSISNSSQMNPLWNNASGISNVKLLKISSFGKPEMSSAKAVGEHVGLHTNISGPKEVQKLLSTAGMSESKLERKYEKKIGMHSVSEVTSVSVLSMPQLKRKLLQETHADSTFQNQLKQISRKRTEISAQTNEKVRESENMKEILDTISVERQASMDFPDENNVMDLGVSSSVLDPGVNVEKAKTYTKELDEICNTLKKKQEQAQELVVRAIVNRNSLLMMNQPEEEKIRRLQRTTASLVSKYHGLSLRRSNK